MNREEYYTAPPDEVFNEIKSQAIKLWQTYDNEFGYVDEKTGRIEHIQNIRDNTCYIVAMFDGNNTTKLLGMVKGEAKEWLEDLLFNNQT